MVDRTLQTPRLSNAQRLWLQELGLDRQFLARLTPAQAKRALGAASGMHGAAADPQAGRAPAEPDLRKQASAALQALRQVGRPGQTEGAAARFNSRPEVDKVSEGENKPVGAVVPAETGAEVTDWAALEARILACEACGLHVGRHRPVPGSGAAEAVDWVVIGEAPGDRDDRLGQPFQGKAGELLHAMLQAAGIDPHKAIFYTNVVKCRPRSNRPPSPEEIAACMPYLRSQIDHLKPRGILALGRLAAQALLADGQSFESQRGQVHAYTSEQGGTIPMVVTYHPASLLSRPRHKAASWRDLNLARSLF